MTRPTTSNSDPRRATLDPSGASRLVNLMTSDMRVVLAPQRIFFAYGSTESTGEHACGAQRPSGFSVALLFSLVSRLGPLGYRGAGPWAGYGRALVLIFMRFDTATIGDVE
jgi:hypothetical protein